MPLPSPLQLTPVDPTQPPILLTPEQLAELDRKWDELFTADLRRRDMVLTPEQAQERKARLLALVAADEQKERLLALAASRTSAESQPPL